MEKVEVTKYVLCKARASGIESKMETAPLLR